MMTGFERNSVKAVKCHYDGRYGESGCLWRRRDGTCEYDGCLLNDTLKAMEDRR